MRVFTCTDHDGHYPVGVSSVVVAEDERSAIRLLSAELTRIGLGDGAFTLTELDLTAPAAIVLQNGDY